MCDYAGWLGYIVFVWAQNVALFGAKLHRGLCPHVGGMVARKVAHRWREMLPGEG